MVDVIIQRKENWIGHVVRGDGLLREVIERKMDGKKPRGRPRIGMLEEWKDGSYQQMKRRAENLSEWRCYVRIGPVDRQNTYDDDDDLWTRE